MQLNKKQSPQELALPPQNIEAEESVISTILVDNDELFIIREYLKPEDFYRSAHQKIYAAILDLADEGIIIDLVSLANRLTEKNQLDEIGGASYLARIVDTVPPANNSEHYAKILLGKSIMRIKIVHSSTILKMCFDDTKTYKDISAEEKEFNSVIIKMAARGMKTEKLQITAESLLDTSKRIIETPFESLNDVIIGMMSKELTVLGGKSGMGKSAFALQMMEQVAVKESIPVIYFAAKMDKERIYKRLISQICRISFRKFLAGRWPKEKTKDILAAHELIDAAPIRHHIIRKTISIPDLRIMILRLRDEIKEELGLVIIENLQQLHIPGKTFNNRPHDAASAFAGELKQIELEVGSPFLVSSQLNRGDGEERVPIASDLFGKNAEEESENIILLHRPNYYAKKVIKEPGRPENDAWMIVAKGGAPVKLPFTFWGDPLAWEEREEEE